jgi:hypothetical protein
LMTGASLVTATMSFCNSSSQKLSR